MRRGDDRERRSRRVKSLFASSEAARRTGVQEAYQEAYRRRTRGEANPTLVSSIDYGMCLPSSNIPNSQRRRWTYDEQFGPSRLYSVIQNTVRDRVTPAWSCTV